jgi:tRNA(Glu) U13 pseudouridine synthase TruD
MMPAGDEAAERERRALDALAFDDLALRQLGRFAPGTRRVARLVPADLDLRLDGADLVAEFTLVSGSYATVILGELAHPEVDLRVPGE